MYPTQPGNAGLKSHLGLGLPRVERTTQIQSPSSESFPVLQPQIYHVPYATRHVNISFFSFYNSSLS